MMDSSAYSPGETIGGVRTLVVNAKPRKKQAKADLFVHMPWEQIKAVQHLNAPALLLWIMLNMQARIDRTNTIRPRLSLLKEISLGDRKKRKRALDQLVQAGLIEVERPKGRPTTVKMTGSHCDRRFNQIPKS